MSTPYRANHSQRRLLRAVLRAQHTDQWFYVGPNEAELDRDGVAIIGRCGQDEVELRLTWGDVALLKETFAAGPIPTVQRITLTQYMWSWADGRGWYPEVPDCPECGFVHVPVLTEHMLAELSFGAKQKGYYHIQ